MRHAPNSILSQMLIYLITVKQDLLLCDVSKARHYQLL